MRMSMRKESRIRSLALETKTLEPVEAALTAFISPFAEARDRWCGYAEEFFEEDDPTRLALRSASEATRNEVLLRFYTRAAEIRAQQELAHWIRDQFELDREDPSCVAPVWESENFAALRAQQSLEEWISGQYIVDDLLYMDLNAAVREAVEEVFGAPVEGGRPEPNDN